MSNKRPDDEKTAPAINPSVQPASGTPDQSQRASQSSREAASPDARGAGDVRFTSYPQNEAAQNPSAWENAHGDRTLSCNNCGWTVSGKSEEEVLGYMRAHARQAHQKNAFTSAELETARRAIHKRVA